jgi:hypothetical protein
MVTRWPVLVVLVAALGAAQPSLAQTMPAQNATSSASTVESLGVSFKNIRRQLAIPTKESNPFRYNYQVEVIGKQPRIDFFKDFYLGKEGGVNYGSPTHYELLQEMTPMPFKMHTGGMAIIGGGKKK